MNTSTRDSPPVRERAVRLVFEPQAEYESQGAALVSIAAKLGGTAETLRKWVRHAERAQRRSNALSTVARDRLQALEPENRDLRRATDILRQAAALFAQAELDRHGQ